MGEAPMSDEHWDRIRRIIKLEQTPEVVAAFEEVKARQLEQLA
jgi:hypothetical protein